jgi:hypothetical protein
MAFNGSIELNNVVRSNEYSTGKIKQKSPLVETFLHLAAGKNLAELNSLKDSQGRSVNADECVEYIKRLAYQAAGGNNYAAAEINEIRVYAIWPLLQEELKLLSFMGNYTPVGYNDTIYRSVKKLGGEKSRFQAFGGDVPFPVWEQGKYPVPTVTVSGGCLVDYRKIQFGDMSDENVGMEQVRTDIRNKAARYVIYTIWNAINNADNVKFVAQGAGVTKSALDEMIRNIRRFGSVNISGDYAMVSQINGFVGYEGVTPVTSGVSEAAMEEIRRNGIIGMYNGSVVQEIKNAFDLSKPLPTNDGFELYFPDNIMFIIPAGLQSPVGTWTKGGLTSVYGIDVATGRNLTRFDLEVACDVGRTEEYKIAMITDTTLGAVGNPKLK